MGTKVRRILIALAVAATSGVVAIQTIIKDTRPIDMVAIADRSGDSYKFRVDLADTLATDIQKIFVQWKVVTTFDPGVSFTDTGGTETEFVWGQDWYPEYTGTTSDYWVSKAPDGSLSCTIDTGFKAEGTYYLQARLMDNEGTVLGPFPISVPPIDTSLANIDLITGYVSSDSLLTITGTNLGSDTASDLKLGNKPRYGDCDTLITQSAESWSATTITFYPDLGNWAATDDIYVYHVTGTTISNSGLGYKLIVSKRLKTIGLGGAILTEVTEAPAYSLDLDLEDSTYSFADLTPTSTDSFYITDIAGTFTTGQTITLVGQKFGARTSAAPLLWDNFNTGQSAGDPISARANWDTLYASDFTGVDEDTLYSALSGANPRYGSASNLSALLKFLRQTQAEDPPCNHQGYGLYNYIQTDETSDLATAINSARKLYFEMWVRANLDYEFSYGSYKRTNVEPCPENNQPRQWKIVRWRNAGNATPGIPVFSYFTNNQDPYNAGSPNIDVDGAVTTGTASECDIIQVRPCYGESSYDVPNKQWWNFRQTIDIGNDDLGGAVDGYIRMYWNNYLKNNCSAGIKLKERSTCTGLKTLRIGEDFANSRIDYAKVQFDDVYIDSSVARIFLANTPVLTNPEGSGQEYHHEIQIPVTWSASTITATVNTGSFASNQKVYLYAIRSDGRVSNAGKGIPIYIGKPFKNKIDINDDGGVIMDNSLSTLKVRAVKKAAFANEALFVQWRDVTDDTTDWAPVFEGLEDTSWGAASSYAPTDYVDTEIPIATAAGGQFEVRAYTKDAEAVADTIDFGLFKVTVTNLPQISSLAGTVTTGGTMNIYGAGFGATRKWSSADRTPIKLVYEDFENPTNTRWRTTLGRSRTDGVPEWISVVTANPQSGVRSLRGNLKVNVTDPITGIANPATGYEMSNHPLDMRWQAPISGDKIYIRYHKKFDAWTDLGETVHGKGEWAYDWRYSTGWAFYTRQPWKKADLAWYDNGWKSRMIASGTDVPALEEFLLGNNLNPPPGEGCLDRRSTLTTVLCRSELYLDTEEEVFVGDVGNDGTWHLYEYIFDYSADPPTLTMLIDGYSIKGDLNSNYSHLSTGALPVHPQFLVAGWTLPYCGQEDIDATEDGEGSEYACGYQFDNIEVWKGLPDDSTVRLGDAPYYADCSKLVNQAITSWNNTNIGLTMNVGTFPEDSIVYLYITDYNGNTNIRGIPLLVGSQVRKRTTEGGSDFVEIGE